MMSNIYRKVNDEIIFGRSLPVLVRGRDRQHMLTDLEVYRDGRIICWDVGEVDAIDRGWLDEQKQMYEYLRK